MYERRFVNNSNASDYTGKQVTEKYLNALSGIVEKLGGSQNIIFAPTSSAARQIAVGLAPNIHVTPSSRIKDLILYYQHSVHEHYSLCDTLGSGVAYHHGKMPLHVRRTLERAVKEKLISNVVCTTTLMQGVNLPAQNVIIRNPHLYTKRSDGATELTNYEMANLRGRAGRLLKDFIGRTIVLDETEFENTEGYEQESLFDDVRKDVSVGYGEQFDEHKDAIWDAIDSQALVGNDMKSYGHLVTYIRQTVLRYGTQAQAHMAETGVSLTREQVAAIIAKMDGISVPKELCLRNRYWDPLVLNDIFLNYSGTVPTHPAEKDSLTQLADMLKFLRDRKTTVHMYERFIPSQYRRGKARHMLCSTCIDWAKQTTLSELLSTDYYKGNDGAKRIEDTIRLLQETVAFNIPLLIKPIVEMRNESSSLLGCIQAGADVLAVKKMIEIGVPRELAIELGTAKQIKKIKQRANESDYEYDIKIRGALSEMLPKLSYWKRIQLSFLA